jgi:hypothetical protein
MISACGGGCYADYINLVRAILLYQLRAALNDNFSPRIALVRVRCFLSNGRTSFNRVAAEMTLDHSKAMSSERITNSQ